MRMVLVLLVLILFAPDHAQAGCKSGCEDNYQLAKEECLLLYAEPDEADDLSICIDEAKSKYDNCIKECAS